jgi:hypothetical protein
VWQRLCHGRSGKNDSLVAPEPVRDDIYSIDDLPWGRLAIVGRPLVEAPIQA